MQELISRIKAILRRVKRPASGISRDTGVLSFQELSIDTNKRRVYVRGKSLKLTEIEFCILELMAAEPYRVVTREQFLQKVWGYIPESKTDIRVIDVHISRIRRTINKNFDSRPFIHTSRGKGYSFLDTRNSDLE